jgi:hypothetical protein
MIWSLQNKNTTDSNIITTLTRFSINWFATKATMGGANPARVMEAFAADLKVLQIYDISLPLCIFSRSPTSLSEVSIATLSNITRIKHLMPSLKYPLDMLIINNPPAALVFMFYVFLIFFQHC